MKSMRSLAFGLMAAVAAGLLVASAAWGRAVDAVGSCVHRLKAWAFEGFDLFAEPVPLDAEAVPLVQRVRQVTYRLRLIKRQRPVVTPRWRMCPSG